MFLPDQIEHLRPLLLPFLHSLLHGDDDGVGLVVRAVLGTLLGGSWQDYNVSIAICYFLLRKIYFYWQSNISKDCVTNYALKLNWVPRMECIITRYYRM